MIHPIFTATEWADSLLTGLPRHLICHFACDCAERALIRVRDSGMEPDPRSWRAVEVARLYIEGRVTREELDAAREAGAARAWGEAAWAGGSAARAAWWAAWSAARAAWWAAWGAARAAAGDAVEREWQVTHLRTLYLAWIGGRERLLSLLHARGEAVVRATESAAKKWEEVLF